MHEKVIVHIDIDCFYAQVEEILDPSLREVPLGIQQKTCLVTCNYKAREFGCKKLMFIPEAQKLCPELVLVDGTDLTKYKKMSDQIFCCLQKFCTAVEKLGMDENYIDVTEIVRERLQEKAELSEGTYKMSFEDSNEEEEECECGCHKTLLMGSIVAQEFRKALFDQLGITSCAGIAHNKLLAKLVGSQNKPNKQTIIFPHQSEDFLRSLGPVRALCGIGSKTAEILESLGITTIKDLQNASISVLKKKFDDKTGERLKELALGKDNSQVKPTGKQKTISIEDSTYSNPLKNMAEVALKLNTLLRRLVEAAIVEQKRTPTSFRVTIRKTANVKELLQRESKQRDVPMSWFKIADQEVIVPLLYPVAMQLFKQIMNDEVSFKITLVGVAFTKFLDQKQSDDANALLKFLKPVSPPSEGKKSPKMEKDISKKEIKGKAPSLMNFFKPLTVAPVEQNLEEKQMNVSPKANSLLGFFKSTPNDLQASESTPKMKRKEPLETDDDVKSPLLKKLKTESPSKDIPTKEESDQLPTSSLTSASQSVESILTDFQIPKDMDIKAFNRLAIPIKKLIINNLKNAAKLEMDVSLIDYPRKEIKKIPKNIMDAFVFKY